MNLIPKEKKNKREERKRKKYLSVGTWASWLCWSGGEAGRVGSSRLALVNKQLPVIWAGFVVSFSPFHWKLLCCSLESHCVGMWWKMASIHSFLPTLGISTHIVQAVLTEERGRSASLHHSSPHVFLSSRLSFKTPCLKVLTSVWICFFVPE